MGLINSSKNNLNNKIILIFHLYPNEDLYISQIHGNKHNFFFLIFMTLFVN